MIYTYRCTRCSYLFEEVQTVKEYIADKSNKKRCPECKRLMTPSRVISQPIPIIYIGEGFTLRKKENEPSRLS